MLMKGKRIKTIKALKKRLKKTLPEKISKVIDSYENFLEQGIPEDAKGFNAHHSACKSAVIHAETLMKLAKWTDEESQNFVQTENHGNIEQLILEAKEEMKDFEDDES